MTGTGGGRRGGGSNTFISDALASFPAGVVKLGYALMGSGQGDKALAIVKRLLDERPDDPEWLAAARSILSHGVPQWHGAMLADEPRNDAFQRAIERAVKTRRNVLDIGTGSGLLAMMAARAGAERVLACEAHPAVAGTAAEIVEENGYADVVRVVHKRSQELTRENVAGGADLIVAEIFSNDLLSEGALATLHHAVTELGAAGVQVIPQAASVRVALAHYDYRERKLSNVRGFDLSRFERHEAPLKRLKVGERRLHLRSEAQDAFGFDFETGTAPRHAQVQLSLTAAGGTANGFVQWIRLQLDDEDAYENRPGEAAEAHWAAHFHPLRHGREVREGTSVTVKAAHDGERLLFWFPEEDHSGS